MFCIEWLTSENSSINFMLTKQLILMAFRQEYIINLRNYIIIKYKKKNEKLNDKI